jgi:hypothetical protein
MRFPAPPSLALAVLLLLSAAAAGAVPATAERPFALLAERGDATSWPVHVAAPGSLTVEATWRGAEPLALVLDGPGQAGAFAREDGTSPLLLRFRITPELRQREGEWRLSIVNASGHPARGRVRISWPAADPSAGAGRAATGAGRVAVLQPVGPRRAGVERVVGRPELGRVTGPPDVPPPALDPAPPTGGAVRRTILPDGSVRLDFPDGSARIVDPVCGWTEIRADGSASTFSCQQVPGAGLPPPPGDAAFNGFLADHADGLLGQIRFLVGGDAQAVDNYLAVESGDASSVVERIDLRRRYVDRLLGVAF